MKKTLTGLMAVVSITILSCNADKTIRLAQNGKTNYEIIISADADELAKYSARELQDYLKQISNAEFPIVVNDLHEKSIVLSKVNEPKPYEPGLTGELKGDGFIVKQLSEDIYISAQNGRGLLYGVYSFLEDELGCRWYSSEVKKIPKMNTLVVRDIDTIQVPPVNWREVYYFDVCDAEIAAQLKLNGNARGKIKTGNRCFN